jgi:hypothetical protein
MKFRLMRDAAALGLLPQGLTLDSNLEETAWCMTYTSTCVSSANLIFSAHGALA